MEGRPFFGSLKVLLGDQPKNTCPMLSRKQVAKIPYKLLTVLSESSPEDLGDMGTVVRVTDKQHHEPLKRTLEWITRGETADFLTTRQFYVTRNKGERKREVIEILPVTLCLLIHCSTTEKVIGFEPNFHADDVEHSTSKTTRTCFAEDIDQYMFSIEYGLIDLQQYLSRKLCSYPVYAPEIVMLISRLYSTSSKVAQHVDPELANFISNRIQCFRHALIADNGTLAALRACISPKMELEHLSRHTGISDKTVDTALHALRDAIGGPNTARALLQIFERKHLDSTTAPRSNSVPFRPAHARRTSENPLNDHTADAMVTLNAIGERRVVRAEQNGFGTLRSTRRASVVSHVRNENFRIARGQYLCLLPEQRPQVHGVTARVVCNENGEIGELFENLRLTPIQDTQSKEPPLPTTFFSTG
jgi:hypothetical protein